MWNVSSTLPSPTSALPLPSSLSGRQVHSFEQQGTASGIATSLCFPQCLTFDLQCNNVLQRKAMTRSFVCNVSCRATLGGGITTPVPTGLPSLLFPLPPSPSPLPDLSSPSNPFLLVPPSIPISFPFLAAVFLCYAIFCPISRKKSHLSQNLKLFPPLVKVDEAVGDDVRDGCVDHRQVGQEGAQVWYRAIAEDKIVSI